MEIDFSKRRVFATEDGSASLRLEDVDEQYHSIHGAWSESMHIYIHHGLQYRADKPDIAVLECGFGTGLNAALTFQHSDDIEVAYDALEAYPLAMEEVLQLNYRAEVPDFPDEVHLAMHRAESGVAIRLTEAFTFCKRIARLEEVELPDSKYDVVYYDMFNPAVQPELWTEAVFTKLYRAMAPGAVLMTYCAKGSVKRALKAAGFVLESLPGPVGKREITRALKQL